jgi:hypothetical protein
MLRFVLLAVAVIGLSTAAARAQGAQRGPFVFSLAAAAAYQFDTGLDQQGSFAVSRWFVQPGVGYAWDRRNSVSVSLGAGENRYDFSGSTDIGGGTPWRNIRDVRASVPIRLAPAERIDVIVIPSVRWNAESGAALHDGRTEGVLAGATWRFGPDLAIGPGIGWFTRLGDGHTAFPILALDWNITDTLSLSTGRGLAASQGPGLTLTWTASARVDLALAGRYETVRFRLDDAGPAPGGIGEDRSVPLVASVAYRPSPAASVTAFAGAEFLGRLRLEDPDGNRIDAADYDPAPLVGLAFRARF